MVRATKYINNGEIGAGRIVTSYRSRIYGGDCVVIYTRNLYGTHNLIAGVIFEEIPEILTVGNQKTLAFIRGNEKAYRKALAFLSEHGVDLERDIKAIPSYRRPGAYVPYWIIQRDYLTPKWVLELDEKYGGGGIYRYPEDKRDYTILERSEEQLEEVINFFRY